MHFVYLDESGDTGGKRSPTADYLMAGWAIHHGAWKGALRRLLEFRRGAKARHGLKMATEMHAAEFLGAAQSHLGIGRIERLEMARGLLDTLADIPGARVFGWITDKTGNPLERLGDAALRDLSRWTEDGSLPTTDGAGPRGFQLIHDTMARPPECWRRMKLEGPMIERGISQESAGSLFLQAADFVAYALRQSRKPNRFMAEHGGRNLLRRLDPISLDYREVRDGDAHP